MILRPRATIPAARLHTARRWLAVGGLLVLLVTALASPALAHARLTGSEPASGATLDEVPDDVVLTFNEGIEPDFNQVQVRDPEGTRVDAGAAEGEDRAVRVPLDGVAIPGTYTVTYRVISADGHPVEGSFDFTVSEDAVEADAPEEASTAQPTPEASPPPEGTPAPEGAAEESPQEVATPLPPEAEAEVTTADEADDEAGIPLLLVAVAVLVVVGAVVLVATRGGPDEPTA